MKKILLIGSINDSHIYRFVKGLQCRINDFRVDFFDISVVREDAKHGEFFNNIFYINHTCPTPWYKIPVFSKLLYLVDTYRSFKKLKDEYDIINIQYLTIHSYIIRNLLVRMRGVKIITPWGSDVYRVKKRYKFFFQKVYDIIDKVCAIKGTKFGDDIISIYNVSENKCVPLCFGSDVLDRVINDSTDRALAKKMIFKDDSKYVITCGYNASISQNHERIIEAIDKIKKQLPSNTLLVFPMTYLKPKGYINRIEDRLKELKINYLILQDYLTDDEMIYLRKGTDLFIHMQVTDAYSSSLHEYLYSKAVVINAEWLAYKELEIDGVPYVLANFENLSEKILQALPLRVNEISTRLRDILVKYTWSYQIKHWIDFYNEL